MQLTSQPIFIACYDLKQGCSTRCFGVMFFLNPPPESSPLKAKPSYGLCLKPWSCPLAMSELVVEGLIASDAAGISCGGKWRSGTYGRWPVMVFPEILWMEKILQGSPDGITNHLYIYIEYIYTYIYIWKCGWTWELSNQTYDHYVVIIFGLESRMWFSRDGANHQSPLMLQPGTWITIRSW